MRNFALALLSFGLLAGCRENSPNPEGSDLTAGGLRLLLEDNTMWSCGQLRLYPIVADEGSAALHSGALSLKTLAQGMKTPGFRITERKAFGRTQGATVNELTVQNRSRDTIFLMSGDVVTGGNQDRVIAHDELVMPGTVRNVEVFCVEKDRWSYYDSTASLADRQLGAFRGYFNVASPTVRRALHREGKQGAVWAAVAQVTAANDAASATSTYAALDQTENAHKQRREACLVHFRDQWDGQSGVVGVVAVSGDRVLGVDIFGHPDLFRRQYPALLHGYVADAMAETTGEPVKITAQVRKAFTEVALLAKPGRKSTETSGKFQPFPEEDSWVHLYSK